VLFAADQQTGPGEGNLALKWHGLLRAMVEALSSEESGQDLVEYALVATMIALGAVATMGIVARNIDAIFSSIAIKFRAHGT
jgi:Flp pilus assembly pilin Flp